MAPPTPLESMNARSQRHVDSEGKLKRWVPLGAFFVTLALGIVISTTYFHRQQFTRPGSQENGIAEPPIVDAAKLYLEALSSASKLLFDLAFATLGAVLGLRLSATAKSHISSVASLGAGSLLLLSLYGAFLFELGKSEVLEGGLDMHGMILKFPIALQFWTLFLAVLSMTAALFRPAPKTAKLILLAGLSLCGMPVQLMCTLNPTPISGNPTCIQNWANNRDEVLTDEGARDAVAVVSNLITMSPKPLAATAQPCDFAVTMLDEIRFVAIDGGGAASGNEGGLAVAKVLRQVIVAMEQPTFAAGELADKLASWAAFWQARGGTLDVVHTGSTVLIYIIDAADRRREWKAYSPCRFRLPPGVYRISVLSGGRRVDNRTLTLSDGDRKVFEVGGAK
jgi:hypothetical protein